MVMLLIVCPPNLLLTTRQRDTDLLTGNLPQIRKKSAILRGNVVPGKRAAICLIIRHPRGQRRRWDCSPMM